MGFSNADYQAGLDAVNAATTKLGTDVGGLGDVVTAVAARVQVIADKLAAAPSAADVATAASQLQAHADTLNQVSSAIEVAESTLNGIAADPSPVAAVPDAPAIVVPDAPADAPTV